MEHEIEEIKKKHITVSPIMLECREKERRDSTRKIKAVICFLLFSGATEKKKML